MSAYGRSLAGRFCVFLGLALSACHGSSSSGVLPTSGSHAGALGTATFSVFVPPPASGVTTPQSLEITLSQVNGAGLTTRQNPTTINLGATTHGCTAMAGGALSCVATVAAPAGTDTFTLATYTGMNGVGSQVYRTQAKAVIKPGATTKCVPGASPSPAAAPIT